MIGIATFISAARIGDECRNALGATITELALDADGEVETFTIEVTSGLDTRNPVVTLFCYADGVIERWDGT